MNIDQADSGDLGIRLLAWLIRRVGTRTLVGAALLGLVLTSVVVGISQVTHELDVGSLSTAVLAGMMLGWWLGRTPPRPKAGFRAAFWCLLAGLAWISLSAGQLWELLGQATWQGLGLVIQAQSWRYGDPIPDLQPLLSTFSDLGLHASIIVQKESAWLAGLLAGKPPFDPLAASLLWGLVLWGVSAWAGWWVRNRWQPLWGVLPAAGLVCSGLAFSQASPLYLFPVLAGWLALMVWSSFTQRHLAWEQQAIDMAEGLTMDLGLWGMAAVMGISSVAYLLATFSPVKTIQSVQRIFQPQVQAVQQVGESLGMQPRPQPTPTPPPPGVLPRKHLIGAGPELSQRVALVVAVTGPPQAGSLGAVPNPERLLDGQRSAYYWRAVTYDVYTGQGWMTSATDAWGYRAGEVVSPTLAQPSQPISVTVEMPGAAYEVTGAGQLPVYLDGELVSLNRDFEAGSRQAPGTQADLFRAWLPAAPEANSYQVQAKLLVASEQALRQATQPPPDWIAERYLALPENLPPRVRAVGQALSGAADNPYDRAKAIEAILRRYPYTLDLPPPPPGRELAEYFLFELRQGFCDYYATAMVVLARSAGLPARLAVGYAQGTYNPTRRAYIVTEADAHSWPEIYFSGIGWVVFEPTGGRPALERSALPAPEPPPGEWPASANPPSGTSQGGPYSALWAAMQAGLQAGLKLAAGAAILLGLSWLALQQMQTWRLSRMAPGQALAVLYQQLRRSGNKLGLVETPGQTPYELAGQFGERINGLVSGRRPLQTRLRGWLAPAPGEARRLVEHYARAAYSPHPPAPSSLAQALLDWRKLERRIWLARLYRRLTSSA